MSTQKRTVLITALKALIGDAGCSSGIGEALALEFHRQNYRVLATARSTSKVAHLATLGIETLELSVNDSASVNALLEEVKRLTNGRLDILVNNAGQNYTMPALDVDVDAVKELFDANVFGIMRMCKAFAPLVIEAQGSVVMIGSLNAVMPYVFGSCYGATKAAVRGYADCLRLELSPFNVAVTTVMAGGVKSELSRVDRSLPSDSLYRPINDAYIKRLTYSQVNSIPAADFAKRVVPQIAARKREIWEGKASWLVYYVSQYMPYGTQIMEFFFWRNFSLWKLVPGRTKTE